MSESMSAAFVAIDGDADRGVYRAMVERSRWNGWARAWFALGEVERMAADMRLGNGSSAVRVLESGVVLVGEEDGDGEGGAVYWAPAERVEVDGVALYRVGDGWVWDEVIAPCDACEWLEVHGMHYCGLLVGDVEEGCGHYCSGRSCPWAPGAVFAAAVEGGAL